MPRYAQHTYLFRMYSDEAELFERLCAGHGGNKRETLSAALQALNRERHESQRHQRLVEEQAEQRTTRLEERLLDHEQRLVALEKGP